MLKSTGADLNNVLCYVISDLGDLDGREMTFGDALCGHTYGGFGTIMSLVPGHLAYYCPETPGKHYFLFRE